MNERLTLSALAEMKSLMTKLIQIETKSILLLDIIKGRIDELTMMEKEEDEDRDVIDSR